MDDFLYIPNNNSLEMTSIKNNFEKSRTKICIFGGLEYIGAHVVLDFLNQDYNVLVLDCLDNNNFTHPNIFNKI